MTGRKQIWKLLAVLSIAAGALVLFYHCPFRLFFGVSCPGCGMTRALLAAVFRDFETAFHYHPLVPVLIPAALYLGLQLFGGMQVPMRRHNVYLVLLASAMILVYLIRMAAHDPVLAPDFEASVAGKALRLLSELKNA